MLSNFMHWKKEILEIASKYRSQHLEVCSKKFDFGVGFDATTIGISPEEKLENNNNENTLFTLYDGQRF